MFTTVSVFSQICKSHHHKYSFFLLFFFVSRYLSYRSSVLPWRQVVLRQFWLPRRDSTSSNTGVGFVLFLLLFLWYIAPLAIIDAFPGRVCSDVDASVLPLQSTVVVLIILTAVTYPTTNWVIPTHTGPSWVTSGWSWQKNGTLCRRPDDRDKN